MRTYTYIIPYIFSILTQCGILEEKEILKTPQYLKVLTTGVLNDLLTVRYLC